MNKLNNINQLSGEEPTLVHSSRLLSHTTQLFQHHVPTAFLILGVLELGIFMLAFYLGVALRFINSPGGIYLGPLAPKAFVFSVVMVSSLIAMGAYRREAVPSFAGMVIKVASALVLGMLPLVFLYYFAPLFFLGRGALAFAVVVSFVLIVATRFVFDRVADQERFKSRALVLGTGTRADMIRKAVADGELGGLDIVGFVQLDGEPGTSDKGNVILGNRALVDLVSDADVDQIVVAVDDRRKALPVRDILDCKMSGIGVVDLLTFFERETGKVLLPILNPSWLFLSDGFRLNALRRLSKRVFDLAWVSLILPIALPLILLVALAVFMESGGRGPIFYRQTRVGENGRLFQIAKFRSMRVDAESDGPRWASANDSRVTAVGSFIRRTRLDELPQLYNILKGEMSFVGPRPERPEFTRQLRNSIPYYAERHRVKPGLTGWAQIRYPYGASEDDAVKKLEYDLYYVKNYSIFLDLLIMFQTAEVVLTGKGAH